MREDIISGAFPYNTRLPSKRVLADELGVSTVTVEHAYFLLCDEGYIEARERSGFFAIFRKNDGFAAFESESYHRPPTPHTEEKYPGFPFPKLAQTMRAILSERGEDILKKSPNSGCIELREALARYLMRNRGMKLDPRQIIIGSGSEYLYGLIISLLGRDKIYAIESPSYKQIENVYKSEGVRYEALPLSHDGIESEALRESRASVLHTTPYRSYPTGITATASKRHEYIRWAERAGGIIIEDDFESEFSLTGKPLDTLFSLSGQKNTIYINSFSKTLSPALRVGYAVLPHELLSHFKETLGFYSCTVPTFEQLVIARLIESGDFERHINRTRRKLRANISEK